MKLTIIGAGSIYFTRQMIRGMVSSPLLKDAEVALVDIDAHRCEQMALFCRKFSEATGGNLKITWTTDRCQALEGSDFIVLTFARQNFHSRGVGVHIARNYGIIEGSGDTAGPGCVFRILQAVPEILEVARDIERLAPDALVINYVNPTNIIGAALDRYTKLKWISFCDALYLPSLVRRFCRYVDIEPTEEIGRRLEIKLGGINHFTWMFGLSLDGKDLWGQFKAGLKKASDEDGLDSDARAEWELCEVMDAWPAVICHGREYVRYFQGRGSRPERDYKVRPWDLNERIRWFRGVQQEIADVNSGKISARDVVTFRTSDMIAKVVESVVGDKKERFPVNVRNEGRISNLPDDCIVELFGTIGKGGIIDVPAIGKLPRGPLGLTHQTLDQQELALAAAMTGNYETLVRAVACDPLVMSLNDAKDIVYDFMATNEEHLCSLWDGYWKT